MAGGGGDVTASSSKPGGGGAIGGISKSSVPPPEVWSNTGGGGTMSRSPRTGSFIEARLFGLDRDVMASLFLAAGVCDDVTDEVLVECRDASKARARSATDDVTVLSETTDAASELLDIESLRALLLFVFALLLPVCVRGAGDVVAADVCLRESSSWKPPEVACSFSSTRS